MRIIKRQEGLTLAEVLVAMAIITIALAPMMGVLASSRKSMEGASRRQEAVAVSRTVTDAFLSRPFMLIESTTGPETYAADSRYTYEVTVTTRNLPNGDPYIKDMVVTVYWTEKERDLSITVYTAVTMRQTEGG